MADPAYIVDGVLTDGEAWIPLASNVYGSDSGTCTFTSPADGSSTSWDQFMDLVVVGYCRAAASDPNAIVYMRLSGVTTAIYSYQFLRGSGSAVAGEAYDGQTVAPVAFLNANTSTANCFGVFVCHLFDVNSGKYKSGVSQGAADSDGSGWVSQYTWLQASQAPVTSITFDNHHWGNWMAGSRFDLFGILPRMVA